MKLGSKREDCVGVDRNEVRAQGNSQRARKCEVSSELPPHSPQFFLRFSPDFSDNEKVVGCGFYEK